MPNPKGEVSYDHADGHRAETGTSRASGWWNRLDSMCGFNCQRRRHWGSSASWGGLSTTIVMLTCGHSSGMLDSVAVTGHLIT